MHRLPCAARCPAAAGQSARAGPRIATAPTAIATSRAGAEGLSRAARAPHPYAVGEALRARPRYAAERWATVFPVGMYAACSFQVGAVTHTEAMTDFARVWVWIAVTVWLVVLVAMVSRPSGGSAGRP
jgi:hypothetical protein